MMTGVYAHNPQKYAETVRLRRERLAAKRAELTARLAKMAATR